MRLVKLLYVLYFCPLSLSADKGKVVEKGLMSRMYQFEKEKNKVINLIISNGTNRGKS